MVFRIESLTGKKDVVTHYARARADATAFYGGDYGFGGHRFKGEEHTPPSAPGTHHLASLRYMGMLFKCREPTRLIPAQRAAYRMLLSMRSLFCSSG